jgi:hypothetical protein
MTEVKSNIKVKPLRTYKRCGRTVKVYKNKNGNMKTREKLDDDRYFNRDYSWLREHLPCYKTGFLSGSCGKKCKKRRMTMKAK